MNKYKLILYVFFDNLELKKLNDIYCSESIPLNVIKRFNDFYITEIYKTHAIPTAFVNPSKSFRDQVFSERSFLITRI